MSTNQTILAAQKINEANKTQSSQALTIQTYSNSVLNQPDVDFSGFDTLTKYQSEINTGLATAKGHANNYLNTIQPNIITNISNIGNYYALHNAVATTLPPGSTTKQWIDELTILKNQSAQYESDAKGVVTELQDLHSNLTTDASAFAKIVSDLNAAVNGDNGVLDSINSELSSIQSKIDGAIAGIVLSGLAIVGGAFVVAVGGIADFVTAGASTPVVVGGIAIVAAGIGGEVASAITLSNLNDEKANLLSQKSTLKAEVNLAQGISSAYGSLKDQVSASVTAASSMQNAWTFLGDDLAALVSDLDKGISSVDDIRKLWLTAADTQVKTVTTDIGIIKQQMTGAQVIVAPKGTTVGSAIVQAARAQAA